MPKYKEYKDSGEGWISDVPEHWEVKKLKHIFFEKKHTQNMSLNCGSISFGKVVTKDDDKIPHSTKASYQEVLNGEFLINPLNLNYDLISLRIGLSEIDVVVSAGYIVLKNKVGMSKEYFKYLLHRYDVAYLKLLGSGVRQTINFNHIANSLLLQPPMAEQTAIANFLDIKTTQIDEAIAIKEKQIELLKERKQIIIQQAVTLGISYEGQPEALMKDSGVDWIGEIPENWKVLSVRRVLNSLEQGSSPPIQNNIEASDYSVLKLSAIKEGRFNSKEVKKITKKQFIENYQIKNGDFLVTRGNTLELVADSCIVEGLQDERQMISDLVYRLKFDLSLVDLDYILFFFQSSLMRDQIKKSARGSSSTMPKVSQEHIKSWKITVPPFQDQKNISGYLKLEIQRITNANKLHQQQIEKLKEYKTTLINSAVTGKFKVA
jgi:type I restriction enzyme S subunit